MKEGLLTATAVYFGFVLLLLVDLLATAGTAWLMRIRPARISLFFGPKLVSFRWKNVDFELAAIPTGNFVKFDGTFHDEHPIRRCLVALSGCAATFLVAVLCLGIGRAFDAALSAPSQFVHGGFAPFLVGRQLIADWVATFPTGWIAPFGVLAAKLTAVNLLPIPVLKGFSAYTALLFWRREMSEKWTATLQYLGLGTVLFFFVGWTMAAGKYLLAKP